MRPFPITEGVKGSRRQKRNVSAVLTDTPVKAALEAEAEARAKSVKCNRLFNGSQEKSQKTKQL
jgi:hypothetical protein